MSPTSWHGELEIADRWARWRGTVGDAAVHRHFAAQAVIAPGPVRVFDAQHGWADARCILIDPLAPHRLAAADHAEIIYVEPAAFFPGELDQLLAPIQNMGSLALVRAPARTSYWLQWLSGARPSARVDDPRIMAALRSLDGAVLEGSVCAEVAARAAKLSGERFRHLFVDKVGLTFGRYVLWRRLRLAVEALQAGSNATTAAHAAGFADAAHFARTLKATFGVTPSQAFMLGKP